MGWPEKNLIEKVTVEQSLEGVERKTMKISVVTAFQTSKVGTDLDNVTMKKWAKGRKSRQSDREYAYITYVLTGHNGDVES